MQPIRIKRLTRLPVSRPTRFRRQQGFIHFTLIIIVLGLLVFAAMNRDFIEQKFAQGLGAGVHRLVLVKDVLISRVAHIVDNLRHGRLSSGSGGVVVQPGLTDALFGDQPNFAPMPHHPAPAHSPHQVNSSCATISSDEPNSSAHPCSTEH